MHPLQRRRFLQACLLTGLSQTGFARNLSRLEKHIPVNLFQEDRTPSGHADPDFHIVDLHCHPNMKNFLLGRKMWHAHINRKGGNFFNMQVDFLNLHKGNVKGILAAHHLPERGMKEQPYTLRRYLPLVKAIAPVFLTKLENGDASNFRQLTTMMDDFEAHVAKTNEKMGGKAIRIAKSFAEFEAIVKRGEIAVAQSIEGSHALGRDMLPEAYIENLQFLIERGVCCITVSHFFSNNHSHPVEGLSLHEKKTLKLAWKYTPAYDDRRLSETGKKVVEYMLQKGVVVDLTHMTPKGRADIFQMNEERGYNRPLVFTHTGVQHMHTDPAVPDYHQIAASDEEIRAINRCGGVIGIVMMNFWLVGRDRYTQQDDNEEYEKGIECVLDTVRHIYDVTGTYDNIAIGSDFDGFADAPNDLRNPADFPKLVQSLRAGLHLSDGDIRKIAHENAMRVLRKGWGNPL